MGHVRDSNGWKLTKHTDEEKAFWREKRISPLMRVREHGILEEMKEH